MKKQRAAVRKAKPGRTVGATRRRERAREAPPRLRDRFRAWREQHLYSVLSSLGRLLARPGATLATVLVLGFALALPLVLLVALENLRAVGGSMSGGDEIAAFLAPSETDASAIALANRVRAQPEVGTVVLVSPAEGLAELADVAGSASLALVRDDNPLPWLLRVTPAAGFRGDALAAQLQREPQIAAVRHDGALNQRVDAWLALVARLVGIASALLVGGALLIVANTVRLELAGRTDELRVLDLLGASDAFIRRPLLYSGFWYGLAAGLLALALVALTLMLAAEPVASLVETYASDFRLTGIGWRRALVVPVAAAGLGIVGSAAASRSLRPAG